MLNSSLRLQHFTVASQSSCMLQESRHHYSTLFVLTAGFGHLGSHNALAAWDGLQAMPAASFPLFIECILPRYYVFFCLQEILGMPQSH